MYLQRLGQNRPYLRVGYTDGQKGDSYPQEQKFDTVICLNVIEHLADDFGAMRNIREVLEEGVRAIILDPAEPGLYGTLDTVLGHERRYTREKLMELVDKSGFELVNLLSFYRTRVTAC